MYLYEFEIKELLAHYEIIIPNTYALHSLGYTIPDSLEYPLMAKVQVLQGKRGKHGGVKKVANKEEADLFINLFTNGHFNSEKIKFILFEELIKSVAVELYCSIVYDHTFHGPAIYLKKGGGSDVEKNDQHMVVIPFLPTGEVIIPRLQQYLSGNQIDVKNATGLTFFLRKLAKCFLEEDLRYVEINPIALRTDGSVIALDAKAIVDKRANLRHKKRKYISERSSDVRIQTQREKDVEELNQHPEYGGTPCRYVDLDGDVALLLSGGGASMLIFDQIIAEGLKPGNYSEYSGNPKREKVEALTRILLGKPNQRGLFIAGAVANFTMIDESMAGIAQALCDVKPAFPIVIRRAGPGEEKGKQIMIDLSRRLQLNITWLGSDKSIGEAVKIFKSKVNG